ncbi:MAG: hypothetical protein WC519_01615 [Parcubacteria group bacterium]
MTGEQDRNKRLVLAFSQFRPIPPNEWMGRKGEQSLTSLLVWLMNNQVPSWDPYCPPIEAARELQRGVSKVLGKEIGIYAGSTMLDWRGALGFVSDGRRAVPFDFVTNERENPLPKEAAGGEGEKVVLLTPSKKPEGYMFLPAAFIALAVSLNPELATRPEGKKIAERMGYPIPVCA